MKNQKQKNKLHKTITTLCAAALILLFATHLTYAKSMVGEKTPKIPVDNCITPNPPTAEGLKNSVCVVEFWATWCPPCRKSVPKMIELTEKYSKKGALFLAFSKDKSADTVKNFITQNKINYHVAMDNGLSAKFQFVGIPTAFVIDHTKTIVWQGHPLTPTFELAIQNALENAPPPFLDGIELGPFEDLRLPLSGGREFLNAYRKIQANANKTDSPNTQVAKKIKAAIHSRIQEKIDYANSLRKTDPAAAFLIYKQIVRNYRGIEIVKPAIEAHDLLRNEPNVKNEIAADGSLKRAQNFLEKCTPCRNCPGFDPQCNDCFNLNKTRVARIQKRLSSIRQKHPDTKAAKNAQILLNTIQKQTVNQ